MTGLPEHTSSYVGFGVLPAAYPTAVVYTPGCCQNLRSAPQKQPQGELGLPEISGGMAASGRALDEMALGHGHPLRSSRRLLHPELACGSSSRATALVDPHESR